MTTIPSLLKPLKDRLAAAREWDVCDGEQTVRAETGEIIYDRSGYDRSEWVGEYRPIAELIASAPTDQAKLIAAIEAVAGLHFAEGDPDHSSADICFECRDIYPCPTLTALTQALGGECDGSSRCVSPTHIEGCFATNPDFSEVGTEALGGDTA